ncbi:MAG TPA: NUDIX domain-containing protein [Candidatus Humimicrobiaceae bacterium]|nr:NUDIX domain-containing protein [Candidatus Humimicrobiaceae bacterium]
MQEATLCFLMKEINGEKELLLAMKKEGFGEGRWNGVGGKFDSKNDKNILATAKRELKEEIGVIAQKIKKVAILSFYFPYRKDWN